VPQKTPKAQKESIMKSGYAILLLVGMGLVVGCGDKLERGGTGK
jgi:hypothetical protein